jgi:hypothetical protein
MNLASLAYSIRIRCSGCYTFPSSSSWARPGSTTHSHIVGEPYWSRIDKPPSISWLNSKTSFISGSFDVKPWSGLVLMKSFKWRALFQRKTHSLSVAPEPLAIWNKKLEGLELWLSKKLNISSQDMYPIALEHLSEFFLIVRNSDWGSYIVFWGS